MARVLVVEDEPGIALGLEDTLRIDGHDVTVVTDGVRAGRVATEQSFDLILLDVMLPGRSGFDVCRDLRRLGLASPIIFLSARTTETDRVTGLEFGANDYVVKPFSPRELLARVRSMLRLAETVREDRRRLAHEVEAARQVQQRLLPAVGPVMPGVDYAGICHPALSVSGDFYDFIELPSGRLALLVADVCGKGMPAALLAATLHGALRACAPDAGENCSELLVRVNQLLFDTTADDRYATMFYAVYDPGTRRLSWTNAGHCPPWLIHGSASSRLDSLTCPVGLTPVIPAAHGTVCLTPGDRLLIVSDGITEARTAADEQFGDDRCGQQAMAHPRGGSARHLCAALLEQVGAFSGGLREDDQTVVAFLLTES